MEPYVLIAPPSWEVHAENVKSTPTNVAPCATLIAPPKPPPSGEFEVPFLRLHVVHDGVRVGIACTVVSMTKPSEWVATSA